MAERAVPWTIAANYLLSCFFTATLWGYLVTILNPVVADEPPGPGHALCKTDFENLLAWFSHSILRQQVLNP